MWRGTCLPLFIVPSAFTYASAYISRMHSIHITSTAPPSFLLPLHSSLFTFNFQFSIFNFQFSTFHFPLFILIFPDLFWQNPRFLCGRIKAKKEVTKWICLMRLGQCRAHLSYATSHKRSSPRAWESANPTSRTS